MARPQARTLVAAAVCGVFAAPIATMLTGSLRRPGLAPPRGPELVPDPVTLDAYRMAFDLAPLARSLANSALVAAVFVPVSVVTASLAALALVRGTRATRRVLSVLLVVVLTTPVTALWIARFAIFEAAGLTGTWIPLLAPALVGGTPFAVLVFVLAFRRLPADVLDAAELEGAGPLRVWRRVAMPMVRPATAAAAMLAFVQTWSNFIDPLLYLSDERTFTAPLVLRYLEQLGSTNWPVLLAGAVVVTAPAVVAFAAAQRILFGRHGGTTWLAR